MVSPSPCLPFSDMKKLTSIMKRKRPDGKEQTKTTRERTKFEDMDSEKDHSQQICIEADDNANPACENKLMKEESGQNMGNKCLHSSIKMTS